MLNSIEAWSRTSHDLPFPKTEYAARLAKVRAAMEAHGVDLLLVHNTQNVSYLTGYETARGDAYICLLVGEDGRAAIHVREDEIPLVPRHDWIETIVVAPALDPAGRYRQLGTLIKDIGAANARIGIEMSRYPVPAALHLALQDELSGARWVDCSSLVLDLRVVKSPAEIALMRKAAVYTSAGMRAAIKALRMGNTDNDVGSAAYCEMLRAGSEAPYPAPFIMIGDRTGWGPHLSWKRFPLSDGDPINIELTGIHHRYAAPLYRTGVMGRGTDLFYAVRDCVINAVNTLMTTARPGMEAHDVALKVTKNLDAVRSRVFCTGQCGYGVGLTLSPNWVEHSFRIIEGNHKPLVAGMTFHSPVVGRQPGKFAVAFSESWVLTENGPQAFNDVPLELIVGET